jgi:peptidase E
MADKQIIAMGGGGFSEEPDNPLLDEYVLRQTRKRNPSVCFVPTATGDADGYIVKFYSAFARLRCRPCHLSLFRPPQDLRGFVLSRDAIYVGGGNTKNLLALWREWGLDRHLRAAYRQGTILGGISAGALCWFRQGLSDSVPGKLTIIAGLGLLGGSHTPHYTRPKRRQAFRRLVAQGKLAAGVAADDGAALHYVDGRLLRSVSSRPDAAAYRVVRRGRKAHEHRLDTQYLGTTGST